MTARFLVHWERDRTVLTSNRSANSDASTGVYHWRGKEIALEADPIQDVWIDGELGGQTPFTVSVMPQAFEIVVPA